MKFLRNTPAKPAAAGLFGYAPFLTAVKNRIRAAQVKATLAANAELIYLYWDIGRAIVAMQENQGWGAGVIPRLARDIADDMPEVKGFSERNIGYMIRFAREYGARPILQQPVAKLAGTGSRATVQQAVALLRGANPGQFVPQAAAQSPGPQISSQAPRKWPDSEILPQAVAKLPSTDDLAILQQLVAKLPWGHNVVLVEKVKDLRARRWYIEQTITHGWSRSVLALQIDARAHERHGKAVHNFHATLPPPQSDLAAQVIKDPYIFDFFILCQDKSRIIAEYALKGVQKAIGISEYQLTRALPKELRSSLPTVEQMETELSRLSAPKSPAKRRKK
jgi:predicted nuclease of restriction endonuclease-like (RecB) superfamily